MSQRSIGLSNRTNLGSFVRPKKFPCKDSQMPLLISGFTRPFFGTKLIKLEYLFNTSFTFIWSIALHLNCSLLKIVHCYHWNSKRWSFFILSCKISMSASIIQLTFVLSMNTYTIGGLSFGKLLSTRRSRLQEWYFTRKHGSTKTRSRKLWNKYFTSDVHISTHFILLQAFSP